MDLSIIPQDSDSIYQDIGHAVGSPIIIDNGSYMCRAGYAVDEEPYLQFKNLVYKHRLKKNSVLVGNDIRDLESVRNSIRTAFDKNIVTQYEIQEHVFDHIFSRLGISDDRVNHPITMTEPLSNPWLCRQQMSELLFECYRVPQVAYVVDGLASFYRNSTLTSDGLPDGLILSLGYQTLSLMPVLNGRLIAPRCMRVNVGGYNVNCYMQRLLQLKYPCHANRFSLSMAEKCVHELCTVPLEYKDINSWRSQQYKKENTVILNLPYERMEMKLSDEQVRRKREIQIVKLREARQKRQIEKLKKDTATLDKLISLRDVVENGQSSSYRPKNKTELKNYIKKSFKEIGLKDTESLEKRITHIRRSVRRMESQMGGGRDASNEDDQDDIKKQNSASKEPNLLDIPDDELTSDERKIKKKQLMIRAAALRREQIRNFKEEQRKKLLKAVEELEEKRGDDFLAWITSLRYKRLAVLDARQSRKNRKVSDNERKVMQQQRIRLMTEFQQGKLSLDQSRLEIEDVDEEESSDSEAEHEQITQLETLLAQYDPEFSKELGGDGLKADLENYYRFHLLSEQTRVPEILFHPTQIGCEQAGLSECAEHLFAAFTPEEQERLAGRVFLTGGVAQMPGLRERVKAELRQIRPFQSPLEVVAAADPVLDSWRGARSFSLSPLFSDSCITRELYDEMGHDYLKEHLLSNMYFSAE